MKNTSTMDARADFLASVALALNRLDRRLPAIFDEKVTLRFVDPDDVIEIVAGWPSNLERGLNWENALRKYRNRAKSAFVGVVVNAQVSALVLIRASRGNLHTTLMYAEKRADFNTSREAVTEFADLLLLAVAAVLESDFVVVDRPAEGLEGHFRSWGYDTVVRTGPRPLRMLKRVASWQPASAGALDQVE